MNEKLWFSLGQTKSKEVYRELSVTGQMCTEYYGIEKKQTETSHPALQSPTGLPLTSLSLPLGPHLVSLFPWSVTIPPPWTSWSSYQPSLIIALAFPSACSCSASYLFIAGSLVLRNLNITCWEQPLPLDNPMLSGYFLAHHFITFRWMGSSSVYLVLFPFLCPSE